MSTLGTFAKYNKSANFAGKKKVVEAPPAPTYTPRSMPSANENRQATLDALSKQAKPPTTIVPVAPQSDDAIKAARKVKAGEDFAKAKASNPSNGFTAAKKNLPELKKAKAESLGKLNNQKSVEGIADGLGFRKSVKTLAGDVTAVGGNPERALIAKGKASEGIGKTLAEGAEKFGKMGFKEGASGARGVLNKVAGRSLTGKAVRLGAAAAGIAAIGGALRGKKRDEQYQ